MPPPSWLCPMKKLKCSAQTTLSCSMTSDITWGYIGVCSWFTYIGFRIHSFQSSDVIIPFLFARIPACLAGEQQHEAGV